MTTNSLLTTPIAHISSTFGSKRENNWLRFALRAMSTTGCPVSLLSHPQISLLSTPSPATMSIACQGRS
ncbi:hypothetical protein ACWATR_35085 [Nostoc sp. UIC 10890]